MILIPTTEAQWFWICQLIKFTILIWFWSLIWTNAHWSVAVVLIGYSADREIELTKNAYLSIKYRERQAKDKIIEGMVGRNKPDKQD